MSDTNTPSVYTMPAGDDDDVLGHKRTPPEAPGVIARDGAPELLVRDSAPGAIRQNDEDDVEGHRLHDRAADLVRQNDDEDDVEGHRKI